MKARDSTRQTHTGAGEGIGEGGQKGIPFQMHSKTCLGEVERLWVWSMLYPCYNQEEASGGVINGGQAPSSVQGRNIGGDMVHKIKMQAPEDEWEKLLHYCAQAAGTSPTGWVAQRRTFMSPQLETLEVEDGDAHRVGS